MNIQKKIISFSMGVLCLFILTIGLFLSYYSLRYSYYSSTDYSIPVYLMKDSFLLNAVSFLLSALLCWILDTILQKSGAKQQLFSYCFLGFCCVLYTILCLIWVTALPYYPSGDQLNATAAAYYNLGGNFSMFTPGGYIGKYPFQKGLTFFYEILFALFGNFCYGVAAKIHILLGVLTMIFGYRFIEEVSDHSICKLLYCPLVILCTPYLILTPYTYGDLPAICFGTILCYALLRFSKTMHKRYIVLAGVMGILALFMRMHTWILLIAVLIGMLLTSLQKRKFLPLFAGVSILLVAFGAVQLLNVSYALRSGYPATNGAPKIIWIAMGMQDNEDGPGTFNNYQTILLGSVNQDERAAAELAKENLKENLTHFANDPAYAKYFFKTKILMQWTEPTFETLKSTNSFDPEQPCPNWIESVYYGPLHDKLTGLADRYQSVVYLGFLLFVPVLWQKRRENIVSYIPLIAIVGGFLFSIIWEAQCRYVLPYYLMMLLYVPDGICFFVDIFRKAVAKLSTSMLLYNSEHSNR